MTPNELYAKWQKRLNGCSDNEPRDLLEEIEFQITQEILLDLGCLTEENPEQKEGWEDRASDYFKKRLASGDLSQ